MPRQTTPRGSNSPNAGPTGDATRGYVAGPQAIDADRFIERVAWLMDGLIRLPGGFRIGLDAIIGLVPGIGDVITTLVAFMIVVRAQQAGVPKATLMRMVANIAIDGVVGSVPLAGDLFDVAFKANAKNLKLYREATAGVGKPGRDAGFILLLLVSLGVILAFPVLMLIWLLRAMMH